MPPDLLIDAAVGLTALAYTLSERRLMTQHFLQRMPSCVLWSFWGVQQ